MKKIYNKIYDLFNPWKRDLKVSQSIFNYYTEIDDFQYYIVTERLNLLRINDILVREEKGILNIKIVTERPGIIIGKGGADFNKLQIHLEEVLDCLVNINLIESTLWDWRKY